jgi:hypothetical protein
VRAITCLGLIFSTIFTFFPLLAEAANRGKVRKTDDPGKEQVVTISVPRSELILPPMASIVVVPAEVELSASNWAPDDFTKSSYEAGASRFIANGLPLLSVNRVHQMVQLGNGFSLASKLGFSYLGMQRTIPLVIGGNHINDSTQQLNLFMGRMGLEVAWKNFLPWGVEPVLGASVLPSWASASATAVENSFSGFGAPLELTVGLMWRTGSGFGLFDGKLSLALGATGIYGSIAGSNVAGRGVAAALRISL